MSHIGSDFVMAAIEAWWQCLYLYRFTEVQTQPSSDHFFGLWGHKSPFRSLEVVTKGIMSADRKDLSPRAQGRPALRSQVRGTHLQPNTGHRLSAETGNTHLSCWRRQPCVHSGYVHGYHLNSSEGSALLGLRLIHFYWMVLSYTYGCWWCPGSRGKRLRARDCHGLALSPQPCPLKPPCDSTSPSTLN